MTMFVAAGSTSLMVTKLARSTRLLVVRVGAPRCNSTMINVERGF